MRLPILAVLLPALVFAQGWTNLKSNIAPEALDVNPGDQEYVCPMDPDIRSNKPGKCPRCGMTLVKGIVERVEYPMTLTAGTKVLRPGVPVQLTFQVQDPKTLKTVTDYEIVHERQFHLFVISQDLSFFRHEHPERLPDSRFRYEITFPKPGMYRVLADVYPKSGTPQLIEKTLLVSGDGFQLSLPAPQKDLSVQHGPNLDVEAITAPSKPVAGQKTIMFVRLRPNDGIELYLGAFAHMMAASSDLIDMIHAHPVSATDVQGSSGESDYKELLFNVYFPRPGVYRVWLQFQRKGVVNTVAFNVPVIGVSEATE
jgi:hypothetical protein